MKNDRLTGVAKYWFEKGVARPENRGGSRNVNENTIKRKAVQDHIKTFMCRASHYARRGCPGRKYLPSDLSIAKMHKLFQEQSDKEVNYAFYYNIFIYDFNLGFGHPAKDICSECVKFKSQIKNPGLSDQDKKVGSARFVLHRRRARKFYDLMNDVDETYTITFDIMENLVLPKTPIGQAYYSRQLYFYVFGIVRHRGRDGTQGKKDVDLFVWLEFQNRKDSNMVASALHHYLGNVVRDELAHYRVLRLFSDSCYGQNKNINVLSMLFALRKQTIPHLTMNYYFPVRGHSFLPADRVFGRIERDIKRQDTILLPADYVDILQKHGNVHVYGSDWACLDFKSAVTSHCRAVRHFKISEAKVLKVDGDKVGFKAAFEGDFCYHSVLKKGKTWETFKPVVSPMVNCVKLSKKKDVLELIGEIGVSEHVRIFYQQSLGQTDTRVIGRQDLVESSDEED